MLQLKLLQDTDDLEFVQGRLGGIKYIVSQTLEEVLHISRSQRPLLLDKLGLPAALAAYVQEYQEEKEARIQLNCPEFSSPLPEMFETVVYRCVQEALSLDQIPLREISLVINVSMKDSKLFLQVLYNGYDPQKLNSFSEAVLRIEERVKRAQGKFWVSNLSEQNLSLNVLLFLS
jgi:signal transduction histidine kinase